MGKQSVFGLWTHTSNNYKCFCFQQLQIILTLFSEYFSSFPRGTYELSVSRSIFKKKALGGIYHLPSSLL